MVLGGLIRAADADGDKAVGLEEWTLFAAKLKAGWALAALPDSAAKSPAA